MNHRLICAAFLCCAALASPSRAQTCSAYTFPSGTRFASCVDLPFLNSYLHWNYDRTNNEVSIAFRRTGASASEWISWGINPIRQQMVGSQALVAHQNSTTGAMYAYTSAIDSTDTTVPPGSLGFGVPSINATFQEGDMTIFATLELTTGLENGVNQVWQVGPMSGGRPSIHPLSGGNVLSVGTLNFVSGTSTNSGNSRQRRKNVHGVLNSVGWGTLMLLGAMIARYMKAFKSADPVWFYLHVTCQMVAYTIGITGWATGMKLGSDSSSNYQTHRDIGISLFTLGTLQVFALLLRPKKDHKYRPYWNVYHYAIGYCVIILSMVNVFKGLDILNPDGKWKKAYIGILVFLGINAAILEAFTWYVISKRRKSEEQRPNAPAYASGNGRL